MENNQSPVRDLPSDGFHLVRMGGGTRVEITRVQTLLQRILPLVIGGLVLTMMGFALLKGGDGSGLLVDLLAKVSDSPALLKVARYAVIGLMTYLSWRVLKLSLGTLSMIVDQNGLGIKKGILGIGPTHSMTRSQIIGLKQSSWTRKEKNESMETLESVRYWKLELQGEKRIMLLNDQNDSEESDWLGQYLADWFGVPFMREKL